MHTLHNVKQAVPFFAVRDMSAALAFYVDGLGFTMTERWIDDGVLRWCSLQIGGAAIMLQEDRPEDRDDSVSRGEGVSVYFMCDDANAPYHQALAAGLAPQEPFVGNRMWVTSLRDPDGYPVEFESPTDVPEETRLSEVEGGSRV
jgi:uncharacterized glyoxalase superfamily protein PhnB